MTVLALHCCNLKEKYMNYIWCTSYSVLQDTLFYIGYAPTEVLSSE